MEDNKEMMNEEIKTEVVENEETTEKESVVNDESNNEEKVEASEGSESTEEDELDMIKKQNKKLQEELDTTKDTLLRLRAEYDNYRRRSIKEKEGIYSDAYVDVVKEILPVIDNLERAIAADGTLEDLKKGVEMTMKGCQDAFSKLGVEEIDATGEFDPNFHNAVMHIEDESLEKNVVAEVFQKGYKKDDKIIRHTMVKVAN
ncbi:nucleotide exchange factor GrpE [Clostridium butyricum]|jgi:molecular chaperone GrpE|uniref:Protein GrpE n=1 Tax=Clostridium butyricum TaxID=1492 RepID=A0A2S7FAZ6_CLOBU|nr:nucleotide exchange factor GrpE [Clostridium butyricum]ETI89058.1 MAG: Protein grpE [Clostridium butyricum DORA_1]KHD15734.1 heat shock protein GrpE [Clostridium butyricum]MBS5982569.1 nucleotide exchange factor GrpE [Clostridium butyricum]MBZ0312961.1 nucleotide exchange factor GrpE [Clostridium butyricum]MDB2153631.1 nucleotide exchange factor GrpE [Clostridium butyricum]